MASTAEQVAHIWRRLGFGPSAQDITDGVAAVHPHTLVTTDGSEFELDAIVFATGFTPTDPPIARQIQRAAVLDAVETDDAIAFTEERTYEAGDKVLAQHVARKRGGRIAFDRLLLAWDAD